MSMSSTILFENESNLLNISILHGICRISKYYDTERKRNVFCKKYLEKDGLSAENEHFINERLSKTKSPRIVEYLGNKSHLNGDITLEFEYSETGSLFDYLEEEQLKMSDDQFSDSNLIFIYKIIFQIVEGLISTHMQGVVHNDIKLENILIFKNKQGGLNSKIADFGNSFLFDGEEPIYLFGDLPQSSMTSYGYAKASFEYDYFCLGIMAYELVMRKKLVNLKENKYKLEKDFLQVNPLLRNLIVSLLSIKDKENINDQNILSLPFFTHKINKQIFLGRKTKRNNHMKHIHGRRVVGM